MKRRGAIGLLLGALACGGRSASVVASVGRQTLTNSRLAEWMVLAQPIPLTPDVAYQLASDWVTFTAFAQRAATGDSMLDSATIMRMMSRRARQEVVAAWRGKLMSRLPPGRTAYFDSSYARTLLQARGARLARSAADLVREIATDPWHVPDPARPLATFGGGALTAAQLQEELQLLSLGTRQDIRAADDARITSYLWGMVVDQLIWLQADSAGLRLSTRAYLDMKRTCEDAVHALRDRIGVSPGSVDQYLEAAAARRVPLEPAPTFLAVFLLRGTDWEIAADRMEGVVERARRLIAAAGPPKAP